MEGAEKDEQDNSLLEIEGFFLIWFLKQEYL